MTSEGSDGFDRQLQPHLASTHTAGLDNPVMTLSENDVTVNVHHAPASSSNRTWERFDQDDSGYAENRNGPATSPNSNRIDVGSAAANIHSNGKVPDSSASKTVLPEQQTTTTGQHPVFYNCQSGEAVVVPGNATATVPGSGTTVIATSHIPERWREMERPLRARQMKILKALSVLAVVMFFPTGIPAVHYAWRTKREFDEGILRGNIDRAQKFARRTERLIILSAILLVLVAVLVFALVERARNGYDVDHSYVAHTSVQGRTL
ncbi:uncharacterized protein [Littorina saxatilis]|uniref:Uncharacterized protein n=1 Tax=Littorina saxatilis TaxID=31220 RepID=A0AAN9BB39_9CAEN